MFSECIFLREETAVDDFFFQNCKLNAHRLISYRCPIKLNFYIDDLHNMTNKMNDSDQMLRPEVGPIAGAQHAPSTKIV